jgi:surfactin synthase thioesterase subunit
MPGEYLRWADQLPDVEVLGVMPPGRGEQLYESAFSRLVPLVDAIIRNIGFPPRSALFGHSLGALVAFETARALSAAGRGPACVFLSGHRPAHLPHGDIPIHDLPPDEFAMTIAERYPAPPAELTEDTELHGLVLGTLRADLAVFETYRYAPGPPLDCPIVIISGADDHWSAEELALWREHTSAACRVHLVPGDHFYLSRHADEAIKIIGDTLRELAAATQTTAARHDDPFPR